MLNTDRSASNHDETAPPENKVKKMTVKEMMVMEKIEGDQLKNEIEGLLDLAESRKEKDSNSKSSGLSSLKSTNAKKLKLTKSKSASVEQTAKKIADA